MQRAAQAMAVLNHRPFVTPDDVKVVTKGVLSHRIITHERSSEASRKILDSVLNSVAVPVG